jgi:hypothetical protein
MGVYGVNGMLRETKLIILVNVLISLFFLYVNLDLWMNYGAMYMDAFNIEAHDKIDGAFWTTYPNLIFWTFWLSTTVNLYFIFRLQRIKKQNQKQNQFPKT